MDCDICGRPAGTTAFVEGARLNVCNTCLRLGRQVVQGRQAPVEPVRPVREFEPVEDYAAKAAAGRKAAGLSTLELAHKLMVTESVIKQLEAGTRFCGEDIARKLERELGVQLVQQVEPDADSPGSKESGGQARGLTLADVARVKRFKPGAGA